MEGDLVLPPGHKQRELISIHSLRMEGDLYPYGYSDASDISIHSLRMEGDLEYLFFSTSQIISIHSLRMEGDMADKNTKTLDITFQSTPSAWRETL